LLGAHSECLGIRTETPSGNASVQANGTTESTFTLNGQLCQSIGLKFQTHNLNKPGGFWEQSYNNDALIFQCSGGSTATCSTTEHFNYQINTGLQFDRLETYCYSPREASSPDGGFRCPRRLPSAAHRPDRIGGRQSWRLFDEQELHVQLLRERRQQALHDELAHLNQREHDGALTDDGRGAIGAEDHVESRAAYERARRQMYVNPPPSRRSAIPCLWSASKTVPAPLIGMPATCASSRAVCKQHPG
jgi:hypothetical protein